MKYYMIDVHTPYCGEDNSILVKLFSESNYEKVRELAWDCCVENATEWYDEDEEEGYFNNFDEYLADCGYNIREVSEETFKELEEDYEVYEM